MVHGLREQHIKAGRHGKERRVAGLLASITLPSSSFSSCSPLPPPPQTLSPVAPPPRPPTSSSNSPCNTPHLSPCSLWAGTALVPAPAASFFPAQRAPGPLPSRPHCEPPHAGHAPLSWILSLISDSAVPFSTSLPTPGLSSVPRVTHCSPRGISPWPQSPSPAWRLLKTH